MEERPDEVQAEERVEERDEERPRPVLAEEPELGVVGVVDDAKQAKRPMAHPHIAVGLPVESVAAAAVGKEPWPRKHVLGTVEREALNIHHLSGSDPVPRGPRPERE